jgi:hypothetical protein
LQIAKDAPKLPEICSELHQRPDRASRLVNGHSDTSGSGRVGDNPETYLLTFQCARSPANPGATGQRYFFTDQTGVIRYGLTSAFHLRLNW